MLINNSGITRHVFLIGGYAIKIPKLNYGWRLFLTGLLCNMQESAFSKIKDGRICPVLFSVNGGFLIVMPRCKPLTEEEYIALDKTIFRPSLGGINRKGGFDIPVETSEGKSDSFGWYKGRIVALDYGS